MIELLLAASASVALAKPFDVEGLFVEACSCKGTCTFESAGAVTGCRAFGAYRIRRGSFDGKGLSGIGIAFAVDAKGKVFSFVDAPSGPLRETGAAFCQAAFREYGVGLSVAFTPISITGSAGAYQVQIGRGKIAELKTAPVLGGDRRTPVELRNVHGALYRSLFQAKAVSGRFKIAGHEFTLNGSSAFFNERASAAGQL